MNENNTTKISRFCSTPKVKRKEQTIYRKYQRGNFPEGKHCNPILKVKFTFILVSSFQVSFDENSIYVTLGFLVYIVERNEEILKKYIYIKCTSRTLSLSYQLLLNWYIIHQLLHTKFRDRH